MAVYFHGTGADFSQFSPDYTGRGEDQYGAGFYFTSNFEAACAYASGEHPQVLRCDVKVENPLVIDGTKYPNLRHIDVSGADACRILLHHPDLYRTIDDDIPNPLGDYIPEFWDINPQKKSQFVRLIRKMAVEYFQDTNLLLLDVFFREAPTAFREAVHEVLGYDGISVNFSNGTNTLVAYFPEQISILEKIKLK